MNILWIFHLILKCINVHLTLSPCLFEFYSELVKQVVAGMLGSILPPLIFKYSMSLGLQIKDSLWTLTCCQCLTSQGLLVFLHCLPLCVSFGLLCLLPWSTTVSLKASAARHRLLALNLVTNYTVRKRWTSNIKYPCLESVTKAYDCA